MTVALAVLLLLPAVCGAVLVVARAERAAAPVALAVSATSVVLSLVVAAGRPRAEMGFLPGQPLTLRVDGLAALVLVVVSAVALLVLVASLAEVARSRARFLGLMLVFLSAVLVTVTAGDLLALLMAWEVMGACSYALIAFRWRDVETVRSGTTAFLTTRAADLGLYAAAGAALAGTGSLDLERLPSLTGWPLHLATLGLVAAGLGKAAQLPFSFWLARAMQGPSTVSALLHSAAMVAMGGYLLLRVAPLLEQTDWGPPVVAWAGVLTAVLLGAVALGQSDLKLLLAASTASQLGFVVLAAGVGGRTSGTLHLVGHAFVKSGLFLAAGAWLDALGTRDLDRLRGVARRHRVTGGLFVGSAVVLAGLPPLTLWATKDAVLAAALERSPALYAAGLLAAGVAAAYSGRAAALVLRPRPGPQPCPQPGPQPSPQPSPQRGPADESLPVLAWAPIVPLTVVAVLGGALALPAVRSALERLVDLAPSPAPHTWELLLSAAVALLGFAAAWRSADALPSRVPAAVRDWLRLEQAAHAVAVRPVLALASALAVLDDQVLDRPVRGAAPLARRLAARARSLDEGGIDRGVSGLAATVRGLGSAARRSQTGQLHQYLAQAAGVLVLAVVLLLLR